MREHLAGIRGVCIGGSQVAGQDPRSLSGGLSMNSQHIVLARPGLKVWIACQYQNLRP
jgi:hypothetical protein